MRQTLIILYFLIIANLLLAQSEYEKWKKEYKSKYKEYILKQDKEFSEFLSKEWEEYQTFKGIIPDSTPKPVHIPVAEPSKHLKFKFSPIIKEIKIHTQRDTIQEKTPPKVVSTGLNAQCTFPFFDTTLTIGYDEKMICKIRTPVSNHSISEYWEKISSSNYKPFIGSFSNLREIMRLNDWGYLILLNNLSKEIVDDDLTRPLFQWFVLIKTGFDARVGYINNRVYLLLASRHVIYKTAYWTIDRKRYYLIIPDKGIEFPETLYIYKKQHPDVSRLVSLYLFKTPLITHRFGKKTLSFSYEGVEYQIPVEYEVDAVKFFGYYPQTEFPIYFRASVSSELEKSLIQGLKPIIQGKTEAEAVNIILRFVQKAFKYKRDDENFGEENYLFPEETIYYPYSDCEDRSILFSFLVRKLVGLEVIGLDYPGHIATAVHFHGTVEGHDIEFNGKKYVICDPTYINADIGKCMPQYIDVTPDIIRF